MSARVALGGGLVVDAELGRAAATQAVALLRRKGAFKRGEGVHENPGGTAAPLGALAARNGVPAQLAVEGVDRREIHARGGRRGRPLRLLEAVGPDPGMHEELLRLGALDQGGRR